MQTVVQGSLHFLMNMNSPNSWWIPCGNLNKRKFNSYILPQLKNWLGVTYLVECEKLAKLNLKVVKINCGIRELPHNGKIAKKILEVRLSLLPYWYSFILSSSCTLRTSMNQYFKCEKKKFKTLEKASMITQQTKDLSVLWWETN